MRLTNDFYPTPEKLTRSLLTHFCPTGVVLEPCSGNGAIANVLREESLINVVLTNDVDPQHQTNFLHDASDSRLYDTIQTLYGRLDYVVTNPPFLQPTCQNIIETAWKNCTKGIVVLLRLSYLEPCQGRASFLQSAHLSHLIVFNPRPKFRVDTKGSDNCTVGWFVWQKNHDVKTTQIIYETGWNK